MTLDEIARTLPNGFHDAEISSIRIDYVRREVKIAIDVWIGDLAFNDLEYRETYRLAILTLSGLRYCCIEPPDARSSYREAGPITVDAGTVESLKTPPEARLPNEAPSFGFTNWFFVKQWNSFLYVSAQAASIAWQDPRESDQISTSP